MNHFIYNIWYPSFIFYGCKPEVHLICTLKFNFRSLEIGFQTLEFALEYDFWTLELNMELLMEWSNFEGFVLGCVNEKFRVLS